MSIIRGGGDVAQAIRGTFTGDGTATVALQTGFEPDVIVIDSGTDTVVAGLQGLVSVGMARGVFSINYYHNSKSKDDDCENDVSNDFPSFHNTIC